jgi:hypothetical protein
MGVPPHHRFPPNGTGSPGVSPRQPGLLYTCARLWQKSQRRAVNSREFRNVPTKHPPLPAAVDG